MTNSKEPPIPVTLLPCPKCKTPCVFRREVFPGVICETIHQHKCIGNEQSSDNATQQPDQELPNYEEIQTMQGFYMNETYHPHHRPSGSFKCVGGKIVITKVEVNG